MAKSRTILVSGGGIAGLTAALCLSKRGFRVEVFERSAAYETSGAGIQLSPNALRILDDLDLGRQLRRVATTPLGIEISEAFSGRVITTVPLGAEAFRRYGLPYLCLHRSDLHQALLSNCENDPDIVVRTGAGVMNGVEHENGVSVLVQSADKIETYRGMALVVADGVHSRLRTEIFEQAKAHHSGFEAWRSIVPMERVPEKFTGEFTHLILGGGCHAVLYPIRNYRYLNIVIIRKSEGKVTTTQVGKGNDLIQHLNNWNEPFRQFLACANDWTVWPVLQVKITDNWSSGKIVMIGDAAHGMLPFAAQGAALAIEDAAVLAGNLANEDNPSTAFTNYSKARLKRVKRVAGLAKINGHLYHMQRPLSHFRDLGMKWTPANRLLDRQSWIYDWRP